MVGIVLVFVFVYFLKGEWIFIYNWFFKLNFYEFDERIIFVSVELYVI